MTLRSSVNASSQHQTDAIPALRLVAVIMKFGRNLPRNQVPEWASSYINYKSLKKLIKTASKPADGSTQDDEPDLAGTNVAGAPLDQAYMT